MRDANVLNNPVILLARSAVRGGAPVGIAAWAWDVLRHAVTSQRAPSHRFVLANAQGKRLGTVRDARTEIRFGRSAPTVLLRRDA